MSDDELRQRIRGCLVNDKNALPEHSEEVSKSLELIEYDSGTYDTEDGYQLLDKETAKYEISKSSQEGLSRRLFYLALPPSVYPSVCRMIKRCSNNNPITASS